MSTYLLAVKLDDFADLWDPYGYRDAFSERTEGIESFMTGLMEDVGGVLDWLKEIVGICKEESDHYYDEYLETAEELIKEVNEWTSKI